MASSILTLAQLVQMSDKNLDAMYMTDLLQGAPFLRSLHAKKASNGTLHKYLKTTAAAGAAFRDIGAGRDHATFTRTLVTDTLKLMDASFHVDKAYADNHPLGVKAVMDDHAKESTAAAFSLAEKVLINGTLTGGDSNGFAGLRNNAAINGTGDAMVVNAGGDTANACTSVYAIVTNETDTALVAGTNQSGEIISVGEVTEQMISDADGKLYPAYVCAILAYLCIQTGGAYSVGRLCNIDFDHTLDDDMLADLIAKFPVDKQPNRLLMSRQSLFQLRASRTATNGTGAPAPIPTEAFGIPIVASEGVINTEAVVA